MISSLNNEVGDIKKLKPKPCTTVCELELLCKVCGDRASGLHYGVYSCEGCKGFFRRTIHQQIRYRACVLDNSCQITKVNRNRCQTCRFRKCISVGMSKDAVKYGRIPKKIKARLIAEMMALKQQNKVENNSEDRDNANSDDESSGKATMSRVREELINKFEQDRRSDKSQRRYSEALDSTMIIDLNGNSSRNHLLKVIGKAERPASFGDNLQSRQKEFINEELSPINLSRSIPRPLPELIPIKSNPFRKNLYESDSFRRKSLDKELHSNRFSYFNPRSRGIYNKNNFMLSETNFSPVSESEILTKRSKLSSRNQYMDKKGSNYIHIPYEYTQSKYAFPGLVRNLNRHSTEIQLNKLNLDQPRDLSMSLKRRSEPTSNLQSSLIPEAFSNIQDNFNSKRSPDVPLSSTLFSPFTSPKLGFTTSSKKKSPFGVSTLKRDYRSVTPWETFEALRTHRALFPNQNRYPLDPARLSSMAASYPELLLSMSKVTNPFHQFTPYHGLNSTFAPSQTFKPHLPNTPLPSNAPADGRFVFSNPLRPPLVMTQKERPFPSSSPDSGCAETNNDVEGDQNQTTSHPRNELLTDQEMVDEIVSAHQKTCDVSKYALFLSAFQNQTTEGSDDVRENSNQKITIAIREIVDFARSIPGFCNLLQQDQVLLLKTGFFEVLLVRLASQYNKEMDTLLVDEEKKVTRSDLQGTGMDEFIDSIFDFAEKFSKFNLNEPHMAVYSSLLLCAPDRPHLNNKSAVEHLHDRILNALSWCNERHPTVSLPKLLTKLAELRSLNDSYSNYLTMANNGGAFPIDCSSDESGGNSSSESSHLLIPPPGSVDEAIEVE